MPVKRVNAEELEVGMYVSRLDRPWRETPFVFQGFHVTNQSEIDNIKQQARHVYVLVPDEEIEVGSAPYDQPAGPPVTESGERDTHHTKIQIDRELPVAKKSHKKVSGLVREIHKAVESRETLDMPRIKQAITYMIRSIERNPDAYIWLTRVTRHDSYAYKHSLTTTVWATAFGHQMELDEQSLNDLALGTLLMDVGLTKIPKEILNKSSRLTNDEWDIVKTHVQHSMDMLSDRPGITPGIQQVVETHHERWDGSGYPRGLRGTAIPVLGEMAGIVDFFTAITVPRPFMKALAPSAALQMLYKQRDRYFRHNLVHGFIQTLSTYPTGSLVELNTGEVGIVSSQNPGWLLRPRIILLLNADKKPYGSFPVLNLLDALEDRQGQPLFIVKSLAEGEYGIDLSQFSLS